MFEVDTAIRLHVIFVRNLSPLDMFLARFAQTHRNRETLGAGPMLDAMLFP